MCTSLATKLRLFPCAGGSQATVVMGIFWFLVSYEDICGTLHRIYKVFKILI